MVYWVFYFLNLRDLSFCFDSSFIPFGLCKAPINSSIEWYLSSIFNSRALKSGFSLVTFMPSSSAVFIFSPYILSKGDGGVIPETVLYMVAANE